MNKKLLLIFGLVITISIIDILANTISFIPVIGDLLETLSETGLELIQIILVGIGLSVAQ